MECDFNCDDCKRTLCTQGNPTLEPTEEEIQETLDTLEKDFLIFKMKGRRHNGTK